MAANHSNTITESVNSQDRNEEGITLPVVEESITNNPVKDERLFTFIVLFTLIFLRKLHKYAKTALGKEGKDHGKFISIACLLFKEIMSTQPDGPGNYIKPLTEIVKKGLKKLQVSYNYNKAKKVTEIFSQKNIGGIEVMDAPRCLFVITVIACDICHMYQHVLWAIDGKTLGKYINSFAKDCVSRIIGYLHKSQGRFWKASHLSTNAADMNELLSFIKKLKDSKDPDERELTKFLMEGLWINKYNGTFLAGKKVYVNVKNSKTGRNERLGVTSNNLIDRVYVKIKDNYFFPKSKNNGIKRILKKSPVRICNHHQDNITKRCGFRLTTMLHTYTIGECEQIQNLQILESLPVTNYMVIESHRDLLETSRKLLKYYMNKDTSDNSKEIVRKSLSNYIANSFLTASS